MCLLISCVFAFLSYSFYQDGSYLNSFINGAIALFFIILLIRNIIKTKKEKEQLKNNEALHTHLELNNL